MAMITAVLQVVISLGLLNVWLIRPKRETAYRGGHAKTLFDEFHVYGLPTWSFFAVGALKIVFAILLILGVWLSSFTVPAAIGIAILMAGAVLMHAKVRDPVRKAIPSAVMLVCALVLALA
jgi:uncharacterized membrane protein HdeD (DUF308 family)